MELSVVSPWTASYPCPDVTAVKAPGYTGTMQAAFCARFFEHSVRKCSLACQYRYPMYRCPTSRDPLSLTNGRYGACPGKVLDDLPDFTFPWSGDPLGRLHTGFIPSAIRGFLVRKLQTSLTSPGTEYQVLSPFSLLSFIPKLQRDSRDPHGWRRNVTGISVRPIGHVRKTSPGVNILGRSSCAVKLSLRII